MRIKQLTATSLMLCLILVLAIGCATTTPTPEAAKTDTAADWKFHSIVDVDYVMKQVKVPMPEDVMIIDARPKRPKYDKNTRGSPFYTGQAPFLVIRENGREKAYYRRPSPRSKRYAKNETAKSC